MNYFHSLPYIQSFQGHKKQHLEIFWHFLPFRYIYTNWLKAQLPNEAKHGVFFFPLTGRVKRANIAILFTSDMPIFPTFSFVCHYILFHIPLQHWFFVHFWDYAKLKSYTGHETVFLEQVCKEEGTLRAWKRLKIPPALNSLINLCY